MFLAIGGKSEDLRHRQMGHEVTAVGRQLDLFSPEAVKRAVAGHEVVINLATHIPPGSRAFFPWAWRETAGSGSVASSTLVDAALAAGARRFIQESFAPVYADGGEEWLDEYAPRKPAPHKRAVLDAERAAARFGNAVVLRFGLFYGADGEFTQAAIASLPRRARRVAGPGRDALAGQPVETGGECFNLLLYTKGCL